MNTPQETLQSIARSDPEYRSYLAGMLPVLEDVDQPLPDGLAEDVLALMQRTQPELVKQAESAPPEPDRFAIDPTVTIFSLAAIVFLLRSHIQYKDGHWTFEHKPIADDMLGKVLDALKGVLGIK